MFAVKPLSNAAKLLVRKSCITPSCYLSAAISSKVAVVLSGCGVYDGSEIHEASAILVHLSRAGAKVQIFTPDIKQLHVINHAEGKVMDENRNVLVESARIACGKIQNLDTLKVDDFDAVIFPGGFGCAKNLSSFATDGPQMKVSPLVERVIKEFSSAKKPIGMCCIAPVLAAKAIQGCEVTVGQDSESKGQEGKWPYKDTAIAITSLGAKHVNKNVTDVHIDTKNKLISTPAFMCETDLHLIFDGIGKMVSHVIALCK